MCVEVNSTCPTHPAVWHSQHQSLQHKLHRADMVTVWEATRGHDRGVFYLHCSETSTRDVWAISQIQHQLRSLVMVGTDYIRPVLFSSLIIVTCSAPHTPAPLKHWHYNNTLNLNFNNKMIYSLCQLRWTETLWLKSRCPAHWVLLHWQSYCLMSCCLSTWAGNWPCTKPCLLIYFSCQALHCSTALRL